MYNKITIVGLLGNPAEVKDYNGVKIAKFSVATTERGYKTKEGKEIPDKTQWHRCTAFGATAQYVGGLEKGSMLIVEGSMEYGEFTNKEGVKVNTAEIKVQNLQCARRNKEQAQGMATTPQVNYGGLTPPVAGVPTDDLPF
jgi:single-strand DNA-binding protein